jgi:DNA repair photolyase
MTAPLDAKRLRIIYAPEGRAGEYAPLACNHLLRCPHGCLYCYAPEIMRKLKVAREEFHTGMKIADDFLARLSRDARDLQAAGDTRTTLFCFLADPYPMGQPEAQAFTRAALAVMAAYERPFTVLTKNGWSAMHNFSLYAPGRDTFATSIIWDREESRETWEPLAGTLDGRWHALCEARERFINTWISIEPVISPPQALNVIWRAADEGVGHVKVGPLNHHSHAATVNWPQFGEDLARVLMETGIPYYLKEDMRRWMPEGFPVSTIEEART